jgi:hypothetical protein
LNKNYIKKTLIKSVRPEPVEGQISQLHEDFVASCRDMPSLQNAPSPAQGLREQDDGDKRRENEVVVEEFEHGESTDCLSALKTVADTTPLIQRMAKLSKIRVAAERFNLHTSLVLEHIFTSTKIGL